MIQKFLENKEGVHLMNHDFTLCGDSFDIGGTEGDFEHGDLKKTDRTVVTCIRCTEIINVCKKVKTKK